MAIELQTNISLEDSPSQPKHLVNIKWVEDFFTGKVKAPVRAVSTANIAGTYDAQAKTLTVTAAGAAVIDEVPLAQDDRVLIVGQDTGTQNGIYDVSDPGGAGSAVYTRAPDFDESEKIYAGVTVAVNQGALFADTTWKLITDGVIILDTTALEFMQTGSSFGAAKYAETITGDNLQTEFEIEHDLGTIDVSVTIRNMVTNAMVLTDIIVVDGNTVKVAFGNAPAPSQVYRVVVIG